MKVRLNIDENSTEDSVTINARELTPLIEEVIRVCNLKRTGNIVGYSKDDIILINPNDILCFYTEKHYVMAKCQEGNFRVKGRLYEIAYMLADDIFIKISQSCICNINHIKKLTLSYNGLIDIMLSNGEKVGISKRFVSEIKKRLGV